MLIVGEVLVVAVVVDPSGVICEDDYLPGRKGWDPLA